MDGIEIGGKHIKPGQRTEIDLPVARLYNHADMTMPVRVVCGNKAGPILFISAGVHGDEINGVEIIRRLLNLSVLSRLKGTLITVPIVNVFGFINQSRYLPDRRDLNRSFPGSETGSLTSLLANLFLKEIVLKSDFGIDIHTGAQHRSNLPHIRAFLDHKQTQRLALAFGTPVIINTRIPEGSLRESALQNDKAVLAYEGGEALRFDELSIRAGLRGILSVLRELNMLPPKKNPKPLLQPFITNSSVWVRAPMSGILNLKARLGNKVTENDVIGQVISPFDETKQNIKARLSGIIIGYRKLPLIHKGDAVYHIASYDTPEYVFEQINRYRSELDIDIGSEIMDE
jgi:uncharacterized protein